jgi:phosphatidylglycerol:prolipoprotein diacylglycerol transferase
MLPYIDIPAIQIGWFSLQPFGLLVATGCVAGWIVTLRETRLRGLDTKVAESAAMWGLLIGFPMASLFAIVWYFPQYVATDPLLLLQFWKNMSSYGGFLGGTIGVVGYLMVRRKPVFAYLDCLVVGLLVGWFFGRLGCTIVHDHPGLHTEFPLGVRFPDGPRHDLGLYEWLYTILMLAVVFAMPRLKLPAGATMGIIAVMYAPVRFGLDFLRTADRLYFGFTPGQYASVALLALGIWIVWRSFKSPLPATAP